LCFVVASPERGVLSFQITILKVLAGHPGGRATLDEVRHAVSVLISSGSDWTNRMKRLASLAPELDIFSSSFAVRDHAGWQITDAGRQFLVLLEATPVPLASANQSIPALAVISTLSPSPPLRLIGIKKRRPRRSQGGHLNRRSAA
jgi:hypothetical protein